MTYGKMSDVIARVAAIDPDAYATGTQLSDAIDMAFHRRIMAIVEAGTLGSSAVLNAVLTSSATSGGTYTQISGKSITALTQAGTDSDKAAIINLSAAEMPAGHRYVKLSCRLTVATSDYGANVLADKPRYTSASATANAHDASDVDEIVA